MFLNPFIDLIVRYSSLAGSLLELKQCYDAQQGFVELMKAENSDMKRQAENGHQGW